MKNLSLNNVEATDMGEFKALPAGGYVAQIYEVEDVVDKEYLRIQLDIAEGDYKDYYLDLYDNKGFWGLTTYRSYKQSALGFFKAFINSVIESNKGFKWDMDGENDESTLVEKYVGIVLREEEYIKNDGSVGTRLKVYKTIAADDIRKGKYKVPDKIKLPESPKDALDVANTFTTSPEGEVLFG